MLLFSFFMCICVSACVYVCLYSPVVKHFIKKKYVSVMNGHKRIHDIQHVHSQINSHIVTSANTCRCISFREPECIKYVR